MKYNSTVSLAVLSCCFSAAPINFIRKEYKCRNNALSVPLLLLDHHHQFPLGSTNVIYTQYLESSDYTKSVFTNQLQKFSYS